MGDRPTRIEMLFRSGHELLEPDGTEPCIGRTDTFFPVRRSGPGTNAAVETAKRLCAGCHRRLECFAKAELRQEPDGVWGGVDFFVRYNPAAKSSREWAARKRERQRRARDEPRCGSVAGYQAHYRTGSQPCDECRMANNAALREWRQRKSETA